MDNIIESVGEFGRFQKSVLVIVGLLSALSSATIYATVFTAADPTLQCNPIASNTTIITEITSLNNTTNTTIESDACIVWTGLRLNNSHYSTQYECHFNTTHYSATIINEWELVCDKDYYASLTQTIQMLGSIFGFCGGILGDKYGRRTSTLLFAISLTVTLIVSQFLLLPSFEYSWKYKYAIYSISQFLIGLLVNCLYCTAYILLMELTTERYRTKLANLNSYMYVCGELIVAIVYYYSRSWHVLNWFIATVSLLLLVFSWFYLPESPAYLISVNKLDEALRTLNQIARINRRPQLSLDSVQFERIKEQEALLNHASDESIAKDATDEMVAKKLDDSSEDEDELPKRFCERMGDLFMITSLFTPRKVLIKTAILFYVWIALLLLYYGISLGVTEEAEQVDPYLMYFLSCAAEVLGYICCYLNDVFGRKRTISGFFFVTTVIYAVLAYMNLSSDVHLNEGFSTRVVALMVLALLGKCAISGAYNIAYIYTSELYPTSSRNTAIIFLTCFGSIASLVSPQINMLKTLVWNPMPYIVYSVCALFTTLSIWYLPEKHKST